MDNDVLEIILVPNKIRRRKKINVEDFEFVRVIGMGGFSTVF